MYSKFKKRKIIHNYLLKKTTSFLIFNPACMQVVRLKASLQLGSCMYCETQTKRNCSPSTLLPVGTMSPIMRVANCYQI